MYFNALKMQQWIDITYYNIIFTIIHENNALYRVLMNLIALKYFYKALYINVSSKVLLIFYITLKKNDNFFKVSGCKQFILATFQ